MENNIKTEMKIFNNPNFGSVRAIEINGEPWLVGKDVAEALGYSNPRDALAKRVDDEDKKDGVAIRDSIGRTQIPILINESGLYSLIFSSKLPKAKEFKRWVTSEVLPTFYNNNEDGESAKMEIQVFRNEVFGKMRTMDIEGKIYFCGSDIAKALGYSNPRDALLRHCRYVVKRDIPHPQSKNKTIQIAFISEGDVYRLITHSRLPEAEKFEKWVFDDILPSIRKYGGYVQHGREEEFFTNPNSPIYGYIKSLVESVAFLQEEILTLKTTTQPVVNEKKLNIWKKQIGYPLVQNIADTFNMEFDAALNLVYDEMKLEFGFSKSFVLNEFSDKYQGKSASCIDAIAENPTYQSNFVHAANNILKVETLKLKLDENNSEDLETEHKIVFNIDDSIDNIIKTIAEVKGYKTKNPIWIYNRIYKTMTTPKAWRNSMTRNCCSSKKALVQKSRKYKKMFVDACNEFLYS